MEVPCTEVELEHEAEILGILLGDGYIDSHGYYIRLQVREKEFAANFLQLIRKTYGLDANLKKYKYYCVFVHSKKLCDRLIKLTNYNSEIPEHIFRGSPNIKARFIRGFVDAEGSVDDLYNKRQIVVTQKNVNTLYGIQKILLDLTITSKLYTKRFDANKLHVSLVDNLRKYQQLIGFSIHYKQNKLNKIVNELEKLTSYADVTLYWRVLRFELSRKESIRKASKTIKIPPETYRAWTQGRRVPCQITQDLLQGRLPEDYDLLQEQYSFLPVICYTKADLISSRQVQSL